MSPIAKEVHDLLGGDRIAVAAIEFPPNGVTPTKYFADGRSRTLVTRKPMQGSTASYEVGSNPGLVSFVTQFEHETVLVVSRIVDECSN